MMAVCWRVSMLDNLGSRIQIFDLVCNDLDIEN